MNQNLTRPIALLLCVMTLGYAVGALAEGATNARERFFLKRQNCKWTDEMGRYIYECVKANNGFSAHWCHNEALDAFCPPEEKVVQANPAETDAARREADRKRGARMGEEHLHGTIEREKTMLKYKDCPWTDEMGRYVYECVKKNNGFGVHWCHDAAIQTMCAQPPSEPKS